MGQRFHTGDSIGTLTQGSGIITLSASRLTVGGQTYKTSSLTVTPTLAANKLYMLYVVISSGTPTLVASLNVNSVGPAGFSSWKLVGSFISKYNSTFGDFLTIEGLPILKAWIYSTARNTINVNVLGYLDMLGGVDTFGLVTPNSGTYTSSTGQFSIQNPRITNPIPGATVKLSGIVGWTINTTNVTNNWDAYANRNGALAFSYTVNGLGANQANLDWIRCPFLGSLQSQAAGDYYEIFGRNNFGAQSTGFHQVEIEVVGSKQIKDM